MYIRNSMKRKLLKSLIIASLSVLQTFAVLHFFGLYSLTYNIVISVLVLALVAYNHLLTNLRDSYYDEVRATGEQMEQIWLNQNTINELKRKVHRLKKQLNKKSNEPN